MHRCANVNCLSQQKESIDDGDNNKTTFTRRVYQVDATTICQLIKRNENKCLYKSFGQVLYLASIDRLGKKCNHQNDDLLLINAPDLISIAIHWNTSQCTTSDVEDFISIIEPIIHLRELFYDVAISDARIKQLNLIGLICFYGSTIEVFFSYDHTTLQWLFCFDGNITIVTNWNAVIRKCIDFHLQPFLLIYANSQQHPVDISQLLKRTVIQAKIIPYKKKSEPIKYSMSKQEKIQLNENKLKYELYSLENLSKISSFATLNSSMLFMPKSTTPTSTINSSYINQETVAKVMQQQILKKESLSDTTSSISFSLISSPLIHVRQQFPQKQKFDDTLSSRDSSTSSQRDSGLSSGINDGSSDDSPRDSLVDNEQTEIDSLIKQTEQMMNDNHLEMFLASIEHYLEQSLKYESASNYLSALESCQQALLVVDQILNLNLNRNTNLTTYARRRKNSLLLRIRSLRKRQIQHEESNYMSTSTFQSVENIEKKNDNTTTTTTTSSILLSTKRLSRPKKNVKFSDNVALIVPTSNNINEPPSEHLIHSFLRKIHQQQTTSDSDSDTPSSSMDIPIGLMECSLCYKRFSKTNQIGTYCSNCHFYMQRFQPITS
ncbi:unnamed protein product [Rotaria sordida]|uniref:Uncharacterized protein n=1 Tax=Rotaria sordida TaxID=392033 RepID=A0A815DXB7_9BILA|nr:unnamed protein product [Rotaria sordida]CAF3730956.1 unnamed protein product [Rotaria sordida]